MNFVRFLFCILLLAPLQAQAGSIEDVKAVIDHWDYGAALKQLVPMASAGNPDAEYYLGDLYHFGRGVNRDEKVADKWFAKAASSYRVQAERGDRHSQVRLATIYQNRPTFKVSAVEIAQWFRKAADQGEPEAQLSLGRKYFEGSGVIQSEEEGWRWIVMSANQGYADAQLQVGLSFDDDPHPNYQKAMGWLRKAASQGNAEAQVRIGMHYKYGNGVKKDLSRACDWFRKAANQGFNHGQSALSMMYLTGKGVNKDYSDAYFWGSFPEVRVSDPALFEEAAKRLTPRQITLIDKRVKEWRPESIGLWSPHL